MFAFTFQEREKIWGTEEPLALPLSLLAGDLGKAHRGPYYLHYRHGYRPSIFRRYPPLTRWKLQIGHLDHSSQTAVSPAPTSQSGVAG